MREGDVIGGRFELGPAVGAGSAAEVFRALDRETGGAVALKLFRRASAAGARRFEREAQLLATFHHEGVVRYVAHGRTPSDEPFIVMEWLDGLDLHARLARQGRLAVREAVRLLRRIATTLGFVHARGVVHRDIKPANVFLPDGELPSAKLLDFGVAHLASGASLGVTGIPIGTPRYMAPEQVRAERDVDARADVFALGCVLFECLTGRPAFEGALPMAVMAKIVLEPTPPLRELRRDVPPPLDDLASAMLAKPRAARPRDGAEVLARLRAIGPLADGPVSGAGPSARALSRREQRLVSVVAVSPSSERGAAERLRRDPEIDRLVSRLEGLADGSIVMLIDGAPTPADLAGRAALAALATRRLLTGPALSVATGRAEVAGELPVGDAIDGAVAALAATPPGGVRVDERTEELVGDRFEVRRGTSAAGEALHLLAGPRAARSGRRTPAGRPVRTVGREAELERLARWLDAAGRRGAPRAALVVAPPGLGKTRLLDDVAEARRAAGARVLSATAGPLDVDRPYAIVGALAGDLARAGALEAQLRALGATEPAADAELLSFVGDLPRLDPPTGRLVACLDDPILLAGRVRAAVLELLGRLCARGPLILVLDDLQWGDRASARLLADALSAVDGPLRLLGATRPAEASPAGALRDAGALEIELGPLEAGDARRLARDALGEHADDALVESVVARAGGHPLFLEELARAAAAPRAEARDADTVLGLLQSRLDALDADARRILRAASVLGGRFTPAGVARLLDVEVDRDLVDALDALVDEDVLVPDRRGYAFRHDPLRDAAYAMLTEDDRRLGHRLAAAWLEEAAEPDAVGIAEHHRRAGAVGASARWLARAARDALTRRDPELARRLAERGADLGASGADLGRLRLVAAEAFLLEDRRSDAEPSARQAHGLLRAGTTDWMRAVAALGWIHVARGQREDVVARAEELSGVEPADLEARRQRGATACVLARTLASAGDVDRADRMLSLAAESRDDGDGRLLSARGYVALYRGEPGSALVSFRLAVDAFDGAGDDHQALGARNDLGSVCCQLGLYAEAEPLLRWMIERAWALGLPLLERVGRLNLGHAVAQLGRRAEGAALIRAATDELERDGNLRLGAAGRVYLARVLLDLGDVTGAEAEAARARELAAGSPTIEVAAIALVARAATAAGRREQALELAEEAARRLDALGSIEQFGTTIRLAHAEALLAVGRDDDARRALEDARAELDAVAAGLPDPATREAFARVADNARVLELWRGCAART